MSGVTLSVCAVGFAIFGSVEPGRANTSISDSKLAASSPKPALSTQSLEERYEKQIKPMLIEYCGDCHFDGADKGDTNLDKFVTLASIQKDSQTWQKVADNIFTKSMPPAKRKTQPTDDERKQMRDWITDALEFCDCTGPRDPGRVTIRRLNREEYNNTIRDLLGVTDFKPAADFPADDTGYGFDNIGDVLTMSPLLVEKYLAAAEQVLDKAIDTNPPEPPTLAKFVGTKLEGSGDSSHRPTGRRRIAMNGEAFANVDFPAKGPYTIRVKAAGEQAGDEPVRMTIRVGDRDLKTFDVKSTPQKSKFHEVRFNADKPGKRQVSVVFGNDYYSESAPEGERDRNLLIDGLTIVGPLDAPPPPPSEWQRKLLFVTPGVNGIGEAEAAAQVLERFAARAYRRPVSSDDVTRLLSLFSSARAEGDSFEKAIKLAMSGVLVSPNFLFRIESEQSSDPEKPYNVTGPELASRLSYFLWSSMPDDALAAASGRLSQPGVLRAEVKRMLEDDKSKAFVRSFVGQWLTMRNLEHHSVDKRFYEEFNEPLRADMMREVEEYFTNLISEDRSVLELLDSDYTFVNGRLAKLYGIEGIKPDDQKFRRVSLKGTPRGGVLTMAGVLTVTAMPTRTSPVMRGKFVLEQLLASAPPPAPANITPLSERRDEVKKASLRERFEAHRSDATCVACHARMDPIGFAMENFDAIGRWRDKDNGFAIDAKGELPEGEKFEGPTELRKVLVGRKQQFVRAMTEKMLTYALGRGLTLSDRCTVREIADAVEKDGYRFSAMVNGIVTSDAFLKRRAKRSDE